LQNEDRNLFEKKYECEGQMNFEECLQEMERYKWATGQYMNLPETEETENEDH
jgi:hypothetical protein